MGLNQSEFASEIGFSDRLIRLIESGDQEPTKPMQKLFVFLERAAEFDEAAIIVPFSEYRQALSALLQCKVLLIKIAPELWDLGFDLMTAINVLKARINEFE